MKSKTARAIFEDMCDDQDEIFGHLQLREAESGEFNSGTNFDGN